MDGNRSILYPVIIFNECINYGLINVFVDV